MTSPKRATDAPAPRPGPGAARDTASGAPRPTRPALAVVPAGEFRAGAGSATDAAPATDAIAAGAPPAGEQARSTPPVSPRALLAADPLLDMLEALEADVTVLRDLTPRSDVPDALARVAARLRAAIAQAADGDVWVTTEDVARVRRLSESAVRWRIKHGKLRAEWRGGRWWIRRADVEAM